MAVRAYAKRYAQAVFEIALEAGELVRGQSELEEIVRVVSDADLKAFLESPKVPFAAKEKLLSGQLPKVSPWSLNLVYLLIVRGRLDMMAEIADEFQRLWNRHQGIEIAEVTTAVPLDREDEPKLARQLSQIIGKKIAIRSEVDPSIIGGFVARIGGRLLDGSIRNKLAALKKALAGAG